MFKCIGSLTNRRMFSSVCLPKHMQHDKNGFTTSQRYLPSETVLVSSRLIIKSCDRLISFYEKVSVPAQSNPVSDFRKKKCWLKKCIQGDSLKSQAVFLLHSFCNETSSRNFMCAFCHNLRRAIEIIAWKLVSPLMPALLPLLFLYMRSIYIWTVIS